MSTATVWRSDRLDGLGLKALADPHCPPTREQYARARGSDRELVLIIVHRLEHTDPEGAARIRRFSPAELRALAHLERTST